MRGSSKLFATLAVFLAPAAASAHEVYVLSHQEIATGLATPAFPMFAVALQDFDKFIFWGFIAILTVFIVFFASITRMAENFFNPFFARMRRYAAPIARITIGIAFVASGYYGATYGPELPLASAFGSYAWIASIALMGIGLFTIVGIFVRAMAALSVLLFAYAVYLHGVYMLTYVNYLGETMGLLILGSHHGAWPKLVKNWRDKLAAAFAPYAFVILRVCFGISFLYSALYAKIVHNDLALQVASLPLAGHAISLAQALGFEPHFLVLGAAIIEVVIACFYILGIETRFTSLFILFWLSLSLWWFGESVWPHIVLIGIPLAFICYGYDKYSLEGRFFKRGAREPVL